MIQRQNVTKICSMGALEVRALPGVSLTIGEGEMVAIKRHLTAPQPQARHASTTGDGTAT
jgi:hypothetical protein